MLLAGVVDGESGANSRLWIRALLDGGHLPVQAAIYTYASDIICVGHRGLLRLRLQARGRAIHSGSESWSQGKGGVNAVTGLAELLLRLERTPIPAAASPAFEHLDCTTTPGTLFHGGSFESVVPEYAETVVDIRLMPGQEPDQVVEHVAQHMKAVSQRRPGLHLALEIKSALPAAHVPPDHKLVQLAQSHVRRCTGRRLPVRATGPANEGYMLIQAGIPALPGFGPRGGNAHEPDEWVELDSLSTTAAIFAGVAADYLRTAASP